MLQSKLGDLNTWQKSTGSLFSIVLTNHLDESESSWCSSQIKFMDWSTGLKHPSVFFFCRRSDIMQVEFVIPID